jgi:hypothetical protein
MHRRSLRDGQNGLALSLFSFDRHLGSYRHLAPPPLHRFSFSLRSLSPFAVWPFFYMMMKKKDFIKKKYKSLFAQQKKRKTKR